MTTITFNAGAAVFRGVNPNEALVTSIIDASVNAGSVVTPGLTDKDVMYSQTSTSGTTNNFQLTGSYDGVSTATYQNRTPAVCAVDSSGNVTRVSDGVCEVVVSVGKESRVIKRQISNSASTFGTMTSYVAGSLAANIRSNIVSAVTGFTASDTTRNILTGAVRNTGRAAIGIDLSASSTNVYPVHLLSPYHFIGAAHVILGAGGQFTFTRNDGTTQTATISATTNIGNDVYLGVFSTPITGITPYTLLPGNADSYLPGYKVGLTNAFSRRLPLVNVEAHTGTLKFRVLDSVSYSGYKYSVDTLNLVNSTEFSTWTSPIISGDSGGPSIAPVSISGTMTSVLLCSMTSGNGVNGTGSSAGGQLYHQILPAIQTAMDSLRPGNTLVTANLAAFPTY